MTSHVRAFKFYAIFLIQFHFNDIFLDFVTVCFAFAFAVV